VRGDIHSIALANRNDLWYSGGGVYQPWTFGYTGRASGGRTGLATFFDGSLDYTIDRHFAFGVYAGHATGKLVAQTIYPENKDANFGYLELTYKY
jgi:hypothetical protein